MSEEIKVSVEDHVGTITFNRPESRNAFSLEMLEECADHLARFRDDPGIRVIVLTGAGESFCAGGDVKKMGRATTVVERKSDLWKRMQVVPKMLATVALVAGTVDSHSRPITEANSSTDIGLSGATRNTAMTSARAR